MTWPGAMIRLDVRRNRLMPTFSRSSAAAFRDGKMKYTRLNLGYRWKSGDIVDQPDRVEVTVWRSGRRSASSADITLRRIQSFKVEPGVTYAWKLGEKSGDVTADKDGLLTMPSVPMPTTPTKLIVTRK